MTELTSSSEVLTQTKVLNDGIENAFIQLGLNLLEVEERELWKEAGYESFVDYYTQELGRNKSTITKLTRFARFVKETNLSLEDLHGIKYTNGYEALLLHVADKPELVLAEARENTSAEIRRNIHEKTPHVPDFKSVCVVPGCWTPEDTHP